MVIFIIFDLLFLYVMILPSSDCVIVPYRLHMKD